MASSSVSSAAAGALLRRQLKQMQTDKDIPGISCGLVSDSNIFEWEVMLMISDDCKYYGGMLSLASLTWTGVSLTPDSQVETFARTSAFPRPIPSCRPS